MSGQDAPILENSCAVDRDEHTTAVPPHDLATPIDTWRQIVLLICVGVGIFLSLMDGTVVATVLIDISKDLGGFEQSQWIVLAYTLAELGLCTTVSRLSDVVGRRSIICGSFALFLCFSMACGAAQTSVQLITFRAFQGMAGGGLFGTGVTIFVELLSPKRLILLCTTLGIIVAAAGVMGPIIGGLFGQYANWRYIFWINGPLTVIPCLLLFFLWPKNRPDSRRDITIAQIDYFGALLLVAAPVLTIFVLNEAATGKYKWSSPTTISLLIISPLLWGILFLWQREIARRPCLTHLLPQLPWDILANRIVVASLLHAILSSATLYAVVFHIPIRAQIVNFSSAIFAGVVLLPVLGGVAIGAALAGLFSIHKNMTFATLFVSSLLQVVACVLLVYLSGSAMIVPRQWAYAAILGLSTGMSVGTSTVLSFLHTDFNHLAVMQGLLGQMRVFGGSIGIAISFTILHVAIMSKLQGAFSPEQLNTFNRSPLTFALLSPTQLLLARDTYVAAFCTIMRACVCLSAGSCVIALFTFEKQPVSVSKKVQEAVDRNQSRI